MKELIFDYKEGVKKGLRPYASNSMDNKSLTLSNGLFPAAVDVLQTHPNLETIDLSFLGAEFPYPQMFITSQFIIICTETVIYEVSEFPFNYSYLVNDVADRLTGAEGQYLVTINNVLMKLNNLLPGELWSLIDFQTYIALSNGRQVVSRDPTTGLYTVDTTIPNGSCMVNTEGQVLVGGANSTELVYNIDKTGFAFTGANLQTQSTIGGVHG